MKTADRVAAALLTRIAEGAHPVGTDLPSEAEIATDLGVSRLTVREAIRSLAADGVIDVRQGRRNRIAPLAQWSILSPDVVAVLTRVSGGADKLLQDLLESRLVLEVEIARLAAQRITADQLEELRAALATMLRTRSARSAASIAENIAADMEFHQIIVDAADNAYLAAAYRPLRQILTAVRRQTSQSAAVRREASDWHQQVLTALEAKDPQAAAEAMRGHMEQTWRAMQNVSLA